MEEPGQHRRHDRRRRERASQAITGAELDKISDEDFKTRVTEISVYARVQPEHKARIVDAWKSLGNIVAMTGDGVNVAPSIKRADIREGMGITGPDVSPEALEHDRVFCGLSGMSAPGRPEVTAAIVEATEAGIRPVMITGDHIDTAVAIAKDLGIVEDASQAITGAERDHISDEDVKTRVTAISVYASTPASSPSTRPASSTLGRAWATLSP